MRLWLNQCSGFGLRLRCFRPAVRCSYATTSSPWAPRHRVLSSAGGHGRHHALQSLRQHSLSMLSSRDDSTIFALSTAAGRAAIAIIRISGPACLNIYQALCPGSLLPKPRYATLRTLFEPCDSPTDRQVLDSGALVLYFPAPHTVTGEDILELHVHGGPAIVKAVLAAIPKTISASNNSDAIRYAEPGEFTRRAFYNNRLDLTQIEALGDTLSAETEQQRRLAIKGTTSTLAKLYEFWRHELLYARGELEALIDFSEDQHFEETSTKLVTSVAEQVTNLRRQISATTDNASRGELLRNGIKIALLGAPNAGKSSLLNRIVGREAAIVSKEEGTTRDVVEVNVDIGGFFCKFLDLAGLRGSRSEARSVDGQPSVKAIGEVEEEGIRRAKERILTADVVIVVLCIEPSEEPLCRPRIHVTQEIIDTVAQCDLTKTKVVGVINKSDLLEEQALVDTRITFNNVDGRVEPPFYLVSCKLAEDNCKVGPDAGGIKGLFNGLIENFKDMTAVSGANAAEGPGSVSPWEESLGASARQRLLLEQCRQYLDDFLSGVTPSESQYSCGPTVAEVDIDVVLAAESLRAAADCLARITGKGEAGDVEEVLGVVFEKFCVGK